MWIRPWSTLGCGGSVISQMVKYARFSGNHTLFLAVNSRSCSADQAGFVPVVLHHC